MNPDDEARLLLYVYGELDADAHAAMKLKLAADPHLRHQLEALEADLATLGQAFDGPEPDAEFEQRMWSKLAPQLGHRPQVVTSAPAATAQTPARRRWFQRPALAWAASMLLALSLGLWLGRQSAPSGSALATAGLDSQRVLAGELVNHLKATERVLLLASNEPDQGELAQRLASELVESHRLYAAAAERAGRPQLAQALRQLEPALIELATAPQHTVDTLLREAIEQEDLPFKARSAAWAVEQQQLKPVPPRS